MRQRAFVVASDPTPAPRIRMSIHCVDRCRERGIPQRTLFHIMHRPFARGDAKAPGRRWAVGPAVCGAPQAWRWVKVIYERSGEDVRQLVTAYPLDRRGLDSRELLDLRLR